MAPMPALQRQARQGKGVVHMRQAVVCSSPGVVYSWYRWQGMGLGGTCSKSKPTLESVWLLVERHTCVPERASCSSQRSADRRSVRATQKARVVRYLTLSRAVLGVVLGGGGGDGGGVSRRRRQGLAGRQGISRPAVPWIREKCKK